jgi:MFS family permease
MSETVGPASNELEPDAPATRATAPRASAVRSLHNRNFRLYLTGQVISQTGNWFQVTAEIWLILLITDSATAIGVHSMLRFGPLMLFGIPGGLITDRFDHLRLLLLTQGLTALTGVVLAIAALSSSPSLMLIYGVALVRGAVFAIDNPLRRCFVRDLVPDQDLTNAVSLNSSSNTMARSAGPALSGIVIATTSIAWCFTINALSFIPVFVTLLMIDRRRLRPATNVSRTPGQIREGFAYVRQSRRIRRTLILVTLLGLYPLNWTVVLPVYATDTFGGDSTMYGYMTSIVAVGAFAGAAIVARLTSVVGGHFRIVGALMAGAFLLLATAPALPLALLGLVLLGAAATSFSIVANSRLQLESEDSMSARVLAIYSVALIGTRPIGSLLTGLIVDRAGTRMAFAISSAVVAVVVFTVAFGQASRARWTPRAVRRRRTETT